MKLRLRLIIPSCVFVLLVLTLLNLQTDELNDLITYKNNPFQDTYTKESFWNDVFMIFHNGLLNLTDSDQEPVHYHDEPIKGTKTKTLLSNHGVIRPDAHQELKMKHDYVKSHLPNRLTSKVYKPNSSGIVLVGGGKFSWLSFLAIKALRKSGSELPIELVLPQTEDFINEQHFCNYTLPELGARCVVLPDEFGPAVMTNWSEKMASYQLKSLALMVSSFQNVLLLDSDNIVIRNPDPVFKSRLFRDQGMILWPDYWDRKTSPVFYDVAKVEIDEHKWVRHGRFPLLEPIVDTSNFDDISYHDLEGTIPNLSTESGQIFINKKTHTCTLLLSMYYNIMGPELYYKLITMGGAGEGDKDTFPAAAVVCKDSFYQVKSFIQTFGYFDDAGSYHGVAMGQKDPLFDHENYKQYLKDVQKLNKLLNNEQTEKIDEITGAPFAATTSNLFTLHCNFPKFDPINLMENEGLFNKKDSRLNYRMFAGFTIDLPGNDSPIDFELDQWETIEESLCYQPTNMVHFKDSDIGEISQFVRNQVEWLSSS